MLNGEPQAVNLPIVSSSIGECGTKLCINKFIYTLLKKSITHANVLLMNNSVIPIVLSRGSRSV